MGVKVFVFDCYCCLEDMGRELTNFDWSAVFFGIDFVEELSVAVKDFG